MNGPSGPYRMAKLPTDDGIVPATTGESDPLAPRTPPRDQLTVRGVTGRVPVIAGTVQQHDRSGVLTKHAKQAGADGRC